MDKKNPTLKWTDSNVFAYVQGFFLYETWVQKVRVVHARWHDFQAKSMTLAITNTYVVQHRFFMTKHKTHFEGFLIKASVQ